MITINNIQNLMPNQDEDEFTEEFNDVGHIEDSEYMEAVDSTSTVTENDRGFIEDSRLVHNTEEQDCECPEPIEPLSDDEIVTEMYNQLSSGIGGSESDNQREISLPLEYYQGDRPGLSEAQLKDKNATRFVSKDVAMAVDATIAEISEMFAVDELVIFPPNNQYDEEQSQQETALINDLFFNEYDGYVMIQRALKDCLLHRNASAKVYWDEKTEVEYREFKNLDPLMLPDLLEQVPDNQDVDIVEQEFDEETGLISIKVKILTKLGRPNIELAKPENVIVSADHTDPTLHDAKFIAYENILYQSELIAMGFDEEVVDTLSEYNTGTEAYSRSRRQDDYDYSSSNLDKLVRVYECYAKIDVDQDGIAEQRRIIVSDHKLLSNDTVDSVSMIGGVTKISPHNYTGISLWDEMYSIQDAKTTIIRSIIDGTKLSSNPRIGVLTGGVNIDDILTSRTGGIVRMDNPNAIVNIPSAEVPQSSYSFLEMMDGVRRDRGGSAIDTASQAQKIAGQTAHGIERTMSSMEQNNLLLARTFSETFVRELFEELHNVIRKYHPGQLTRKINGKWISQVPNNWNRRRSLIVTLGGSEATKRKKVAALGQVINYQKELLMNKSGLANEDKLFNSLRTISRLSNIKDPEAFFVDPDSKEYKQEQATKTQKEAQEKEKNDQSKQMMVQAQAQIGQAELMKGQASLQSAQAKLQVEQMKVQIEQLKAVIDKNESDAELAFKYEELNSQNALKATELGIKTDTTSEEVAEDYVEHKMVQDYDNL